MNDVSDFVGLNQTVTSKVIIKILSPTLMLRNGLLDLAGLCQTEAF